MAKARETFVSLEAASGLQVGTICRTAGDATITTIEVQFSPASTVQVSIRRRSRGADNFVTIPGGASISTTTVLTLFGPHPELVAEIEFAGVGNTTVLFDSISG